LAAANPCNEIYDYNEPIIANMRFPVDLLEKFDIVVPFLPNSDEDIEEFFQRRQEKQKDTLDESTSVSQLENDFFNSTASSSTPAKTFHWLKKNRDENLPRLSKNDIQTYVKFALDSCRPKLSREAASHLKEFYRTYLVEIPPGYEDAWSRIHDMESLVRLTLARARIDFAETATLEHAQQVLSLFRAAQIDTYPHHDVSQDLSQANLSTTMLTGKKTEDIRKMSKPKQMKAFMEYLKNKCEEKKQNVFNTPQMLEMAIDLGINDYYEVINRLNMDGFILKTGNGYKITKQGF
jgi:DNA helicase MCM8